MEKWQIKNRNDSKKDSTNGFSGKIKALHS